MDDEAENLEAAFGDSSDDDDLADRPEKETLGIRDSTVWERVEEINGLWLCKNFLSIVHQSDLISAILNEGWFVEESMNQCCLLIYCGENLCLTSSLSIYTNQGICAHVDLLRFEDGIAIVSLESPCVMRFSPTEKEEDEDVDVLLSPGSLILMSGEVRYQWKHEINRKQKGFQVWEGEEIDQKRRISITLRKLCQA